ncbi:hypothetical protein D9M68_884020 [compost metagenome]
MEAFHRFLVAVHKAECSTVFVICREARAIKQTVDQPLGVGVRKVAQRGDVIAIGRAVLEIFLEGSEKDRRHAGLQSALEQDGRSAGLDVVVERQIALPKRGLVLALDVLQAMPIPIRLRLIGEYQRL